MDKPLIIKTNDKFLNNGDIKNNHYMNFSKTIKQVTLALLLASAITANGQTKQEEKAYKKVLNERADKIVQSLNIQDQKQLVKVRDLIAGQYFDINTIQGKRDTLLKKTREEAKVKVIKEDADKDISKLHKKYLAKLSTLLSEQQVEKVKDGMTYNVVPLTYHNYLLMLPHLTQTQQSQIKAFLIEAREHAMDGGSSKEKHGWFGKYKGKIANYLTAQGFNLKEEGNLWAKRRNLNSADLEIVESSRITASLKIADAAKKEQVRNLLAHQYQTIQEALNERNAKMDSALKQPSKSKEEVEKEASAIWNIYKTQLDGQRNRFVTLLSTFTDSAQVELVKNEMTDNGLDKEYTHFQALLPNLTEPQKKQVYEYLLEARDNAMNVLNAKERHKWFIKYRGRANNYLAKQGYNLRQATEDLERKLAAQKENKQ